MLRVLLPDSIYLILCAGLIAWIWSANANVRLIFMMARAVWIDQSARCDNENICTASFNALGWSTVCPQAIY